MNIPRKPTSFMLLVAAVTLLLSLGESARGDVWMVLNPLNSARSDHTSTLLPNGRVLIVGGGPNAASAELFDPATGHSTVTGAPNDPRSGHTAVVLPNGKVLVAGGGDLNTAELYDPTTGTWSRTGALNTARCNHTATLLSNGKVLVAGGRVFYRGDPIDSAELYDPATGTWSVTGSLNSARFYHTATLLPTGQVLVAAGTDSVDDFATAELYDPATGTWTLTSPLSAPREAHTATLLPNGKVLVAGGWDGEHGVDLAEAELYDPASGTWAVTGSMTAVRDTHAACLLSNGQVLVAGGGGAPHSPPLYGYRLTAELYDPSAGTWAPARSLHTARHSHTMTLLPTGQVLLTGGINWPSGWLAEVELYDPAPTPAVLQSPRSLPDGSFQFRFTSTPGALLDVLATTNLALPLTDWTRLGNPSEGLPGQFQFTDLQTPNTPQRFYRVVAP